ncbi:uncharacterized protein UTRI_10114 [Ustilago trichophora]|uniref:Uncharacterized protein n=1 Tax=Ustilago trichophora TaxID=86804 RepID=A0A5C3E659_9BASI|nr:uncharacterized protein UTRI_10114 [Ustilago trichophora]
MQVAYLLIPFIFITGAFSVNPKNLPKIVKQFDETVDLWKGLYSGGYLPGSHSVHSNTPPTSGWLEYLEENGYKVLKLSFDRMSTYKKTDAAREEFEVLLKYARDPLAQQHLVLKDQSVKRAAHSLIKKYAEHLQSRPQNVVVYRALKSSPFARSTRIIHSASPSAFGEANRLGNEKASTSDASAISFGEDSK